MKTLMILLAATAFGQSIYPTREQAIALAANVEGYQAGWMAVMQMMATQAAPKRTSPGRDIITAARIKAACEKARRRYRPCYPTVAVPKPKACSSEMNLMQNMLPVMDKFAELTDGVSRDIPWNSFAEPARLFVEAVEAMR